MAKRRATEPGAGAGAAGAYENDHDHRLGPDAQSDIDGVISRVIMGFTGPSGVVDLECDLQVNDVGSHQKLIVRKLWERGGGPRIIVLEKSSDAADHAGAEYFDDPHTSQRLKILESFPCTASNASMLSAYVIHTASTWAPDDFDLAEVMLRLFKLPAVSVEINIVSSAIRHSSEGGNYEPWQRGYADIVRELTSDELQRAAIQTSDKRAYVAAKLVAIRELASMWCKAELTLGRDA